MTKMKKFGALLLALVLALSLSAPAFAADMEGEEGVIGEFTTPDTEISPLPGATVTIYKEITALNPEPCVVNAPTITYTYAISAGDAGKTITDASSHHNQVNSTDVNVTVTTKAGITPAAIKITGKTSTNTTNNNKQLAITPADQLDASSFGTANRFDIDIDFSDVDFTTAPGTGAGVYRYVIAETCTEATKNAAGIREGSVANTLYMDVYVNGDGDIYGYTLFTTNDNIDASPDDDAGAAADVGKIEGFVGAKADGSAYTGDDSAADKYYTFNFDVSKDVVNDAYAETTHHEFPFSVEFVNSNVTANVLPKVTKTGNATFTAPTTAGAIASFNFDGAAATPTNSLTIADSAVVSFVGIPCGTSVTIYEKNDVTGVTYSAVSTGAHTNAVAKVINTGVVSNNATITCTSHITRATENHTDGFADPVLFTNTLLEISPTGVVIRVAPFALMLGFGIMFLAVIRRRREEEDYA